MCLVILCVGVFGKVDDISLFNWLTGTMMYYGWWGHQDRSQKMPLSMSLSSTDHRSYQSGHA